MDGRSEIDMDEFEKFSIPILGTSIEDDVIYEVSRGGKDQLYEPYPQLPPERSDDVEIFPSPVDIYEVRKAWYGYGDHRPCISDERNDVSLYDSHLNRHAKNCCVFGPDEEEFTLPFNTIIKSCISSNTEDSIIRSDLDELNSSKEKSITRSRSTNERPSYISLLSTPALTAADHVASTVNESMFPCLERTVCRVRSFSTDNGRVLNLGDSFKIFNRPRTHPTDACWMQSKTCQPPQKNYKHAEKSGRNPGKTNSKKCSGRQETWKTSGAGGLLGDKPDGDDGCEWSDLETNDVYDESKELLDRSQRKESRAMEEEEDEEDEEEAEEEDENSLRYGPIRKRALLDIPSPKNDSDAAAPIALMTLGNDEGGEDDGTGNHSTTDNPLLRVMILGSQGVGKTTLTQQLMTSEYRPTDFVTFTDNCFDEQQMSNVDNMIVVQVDEVQSLVQFIDIPSEVGIGKRRGGNLAATAAAATAAAAADAYLVLYSVTDRSSFKFARACLRQLIRKSSSSSLTPVVILVANKQDLVRKRVVSETSGKNLALKRRCKYIEISAFLDHRVDELLVGILKQLQLQQQRQCSISSSADIEDDDDELGDNNSKAGCLRRASLMRLWRRMSWCYCQSYHFSSCDDLFVL